MSADTGAVDAAVISEVAGAIDLAMWLDGEYGLRHCMDVKSVLRDAAIAAIAAFQRANAERVTALVDAFHDAAKEYGQLSALSEQPWADSDAEPDARRKSDDAYAALLLAVVGPEVQE